MRASARTRACSASRTCVSAKPGIVRIPSALVSFNLGVEAGQLVVIVVLVGLVALARKRIATFDPRGVRVLSAGVAVTGVVLAIVRLL